MAPGRAIAKSDPVLGVRGARLHNLRDVDVDIPLGRLVVVTGVSGSGKSSLARDVLLANLRHALGDAQAQRKLARKSPGARAPALQWQGCRAITGWESLDRVLEVDQTPIGKTPRSCTATYVGIWDAIRKRYAETTEAKVRGFAASRFSFNTAGGRCPGCEGQGLQTIEMSFLPDVKIVCDQCGGQRFEKTTLEVLWRGKSIGDVLRMEIDEAVPFFSASPPIAHALQLLEDVGLGYLTLGQASPTLSGGEAQRIKLVTELAKARTAQPLPGRAAGGRSAASTLYVLDEPTVGLSMADVELLLKALHRLVDAGHSVIVVEHNLDMIAQADWIIDLGPDGGDAGGQLVGAGPPAALAALDTPTGAALRGWLRRG
jgi:excinuclease ABC subunit A